MVVTNGGNSNLPKIENGLQIVTEAQEFCD